MNKLMKFVYSAVITVIAGAAASYFTRFGIYNWYAALDKPTITPPDAVFPIVWTILYLLMIIAFYRVLTKADAERQRRANQLFWAVAAAGRLDLFFLYAGVYRTGFCGDYPSGFDCLQNDTEL